MVENGNAASPVVYGDRGPEIQPIHPVPLTPNGWPILPPPIGPEVVMRYARAMAGDPQVSAILARLGKWAQPSRGELEVLERFRDEWIARNGLLDHGLNAYFGANMVFRRIAWGQIGSLDDPRVMIFLREDAPRNVGGPVTGNAIGARLDEILWLANHVIECCDFWPLYADEWRNSGIAERYYAGQVYFDGFLRTYYFPKYGYYNRLIKHPCMKTLERIALGRLGTLSGQEAWKAIQDDKYSTLSKVFQEKLD